jgi:hypothetical protein
VRARRWTVVVGIVVAAAILALLAVRGDWLSGGGPPPAPPRVPRPLAPAPPRQAVGYVRDANGHPIAGVTLRLARSRRAATTDGEGRYELSAPASGTLEAVARGYARQYVALEPSPPGQGARIDYALARTRVGAHPAANSADRVILWAGCDRIAGMSAATVQRWIDRGVDGFVCSVGWLRDLGGTNDFSGARGASLDGEGFALQRKLRASAVVKQARRGRLKLYLGMYASDSNNKQTPFREWFDDRAWGSAVIPHARDLAAAARSLGMAGVAIDQELYETSGGDPSWSWRYPGNTHSEADTRARAVARGRELMQAFVSAFPGVEVAAYATQLRDSWEDKVQEVVNHQPTAFDDDLRLDLWNGMTSVQGYSAILWLDAIFYKTPHLGDDWEPALRYNASSVYSLLSRHFSNWAYASQRLNLSPFAWVDAGPSEFERARGSDYVKRQLQAFRRWGTGGAFGIYAHDEFTKFDYGPYEDAIREASTPGTVDERPPQLSVASTAGPLAGTASDDFAIRVVRWYDDEGGFGAAKMSWQPSARPQDGYRGQVAWTVDGSMAAGRRVTVVAEDIKGLATTRTLTIGR